MNLLRYRSGVPLIDCLVDLYTCLILIPGYVAFSCCKNAYVYAAHAFPHSNRSDSGGEEEVRRERRKGKEEKKKKGKEALYR